MRMTELFQRINLQQKRQDQQSRGEGQPYQRRKQLPVRDRERLDEAGASDDEDVVEFDWLEMNKQNLLHELRVKCMVMNGRSRKS